MAVFDVASIDYDETFSNSHIGRLLRTTVWEQLDTIITTPKQDILEINCGTGEDAVYLANKGHRVTATDISAGMITAANSKAKLSNLHFIPLSFTELTSHFEPNSFDIVLSNFGGLNCIDEGQLEKVLSDIYTLLRQGGKFIGVIMAKHCMWEIGYYICKGRFRTAFRRFNNEGAKTTLGAESLLTYYYHPKQLKRLAQHKLKYLSAYPVGLFIPPSYMEGYFKKHMRQLDFLGTLDRMTNKTKILAPYSDHFMIVMEKTI